MPFRSITVVLLGTTGGLDAALRRGAGQVDQFSRKVQGSDSTLQKLGKGAAVVGAGLAVLFVTSIAKAAEFEKRVRNIQSITSDKSFQGETGFKRITNELLEMSKTVPQTANELADGLYDIVSSGRDGAGAMNILKVSAVAASAGLSTTAASAKAIVSILNAYNLSSDKAAHVSDVLFATVRDGVVTFDELTAATSHFVGNAAAAHVSIEEAGAALATMTLSGLSASEAAVSLNNLLGKLVKPNKDLAAAASGAGISLSKDLANPAIGLRGVLQELYHATGNNKVAFANLFSEIRARRGALSLMADDGVRLSAEFVKMMHSSDGAGDTMEALREQSKGLSFQLKEAGNRINAMAIELGLQLIPHLKDALDWLLKTGGQAKQFGAELVNRVKPGVRDVADAVASLSRIGRNLWDDFGPFIKGIGGLALGGAILAFNTLGKSLSATTDFLADHSEAVRVTAILLGTLLIPRLLVTSGILARTAWLAAVRGIQALGASIAAAGGRLAYMNPLLIAFTAAVGTIAFLTLKGSAANKTYKGSIDDLTDAWKRNAKEQPQAVFEAISKAVGPDMIGLLHQANINTGALFATLAKGGPQASTAIDGVTKSLQEAGVPAPLIDKVSKSLHGVAGASTDAKTRVAEAATTQEQYNDKLRSTDSLTNKVVKAESDLATANDNMKKATDDANKTLSSQNDLLVDNRKQAKLTAKDLQDIVTKNVKDIAEESKNITKLLAEGIDKGLLQSLIEKGPQYVAAAATLGQGQVRSLSSEWNQGLQAENVRTAQLVALMAPGAVTAYQQALRREHDVLGEANKVAFSDTLKTALGIASGSADRSGKAIPEQYQARVYAQRQATLNAYLNTLNAPLRESIQQALGFAQAGGKGIPDQIATGINIRKASATSAMSGIVGALQRSIDSLHGTTVSVNVNEVTSTARLIGAAGRAGGGVIRGPGGGTDDRAGIFALSNYEYVNRAAVVRREGVAAFDALNAGRARIVPGLAAGGLVNIRTEHPSGASVVGAAVGNAKAIMRSILNEFTAGMFGGGIGGSVAAVTLTARKVLGLLGRPLTELGAWVRRIMYESGGSPTIVNRTDSNWRAGHPSVGEAQVIAGTFASYAGPFRNVGPFLYGVSTNPVANQFAGANYAVHRYGSLAAVDPLIRRSGYDQGGPLYPGWTLAYNGTGRTEQVISPSQSSQVTFAPVVNIHVMGGDSPQVTAQAIRREVQGVMGSYVRQLTVGAGRY